MLIEYTSLFGVTKVTCPCGGNCTYLSVEDDMILPTTTKEEKMEAESNQYMNLDWVENDVVVTKTYTESDVRNMIWVNKNLTNKQNEWYKQISQVRTILEESYADSSDQDTLQAIAEALDISLTKEIEVTVWVRVDATVEVDMTVGDFDSVEQFVMDNLTVDSYGSEMSINNYDVERVEKGAY